MKRILYIVFVWMAAVAFAQEQMPQQFQANCPGELPSSPYYYCECRNTSRPFAFPLEVEVTDTMWYSATIEDMKQGICAYWISDCSITFEIYAFCSSKTPSFTMTVNANQMREMSVETINKKLEAMGDQAEALGQLLTPRIRVYPNGGTGKVYCYPYDQGPVSSCEAPLRLIPYMTYVCDKDTEVYELKPENISSKGRGFIRWKQKKNLPGTIWLTEGSCDGPEIGRAVMSDSLRVFLLDSVRLLGAKQADKSIFVHVAHDSTYVGRVIYRNTIKWDEQRIDTTLCQGKSLQLTDTVLRESTVYPNDTLWRRGDTLSLTTYYLTVEPPTPQYDTLKLKYNQFPYTYRNNVLPKEGWGDYDFTIRKADKCDERYLLHVEHNYVTKTNVVDTTLCLGKTIKINNVTYSKDTVIRDSVWTYAAATNSTPDTYTIRDISIHFTEPDIEYDTISVLPSKMPSYGYYYSKLGVRVFYGDTLIVKKTTNGKTCTRYIQLHVGMDVNMTKADTDTTLCLGKAVTFNNRTYATDTTFYDTIQVDEDTWRIGTIRIHFTEPEMELDTVVIAPSEMTPDGYHYEALDVVLTAYGDTMIVKTAENECTRRIQLHFAFDTTAIRTETDTTLCMGKTVMVSGVSYAADTTVYDSVWMEPGLWMINTISMHFTAPEMEYDSISLTKSLMDSLGGYWYDSLEVMIAAFGDTLIVKTADDECTRYIQLHVEEEPEPIDPHEAIDNTWAPAAGAYKYLHKGNLYIRREGKDYDLLGRPANRK